MNILRSIFKPKAQGSQFTKALAKPSKPDLIPEPGRAAQLVGAGAAGGALVGIAAGGIKAQLDINKVPYQEVTVSHQEPIYKRELAGHRPPDDYVRGSLRPSDDGVPTQAVYVNNPEYNRDGTPQTRYKDTTFRGRGEPQETQWNTEEITHKTMNGYSYSTLKDRERYLSHYESVTKYRNVPYSASVPYEDCVNSYDSYGGTSRHCVTRTRTVTKYRQESYQEQRPVYKWRTVGYWQNYRANIQSRVVGSVQKPSVEFNHGVNVGQYLVKGALWGMGIGALAGGVTAAMEERFFPGLLPGSNPVESASPDPKPSPEPKPSPTPRPGPAPEPKPRPTPRPDPTPGPRPPSSSKGPVVEHHHPGIGRHSHAGGGSWHKHSSPSRPGRTTERSSSSSPIRSGGASVEHHHPGTGRHSHSGGGSYHRH